MQTKIADSVGNFHKVVMHFIPKLGNCIKNVSQ